ncbi:MAG: M20/M25/M40 family metallo-hydrolase [Gemmatimonadota bacterium]
MTSTARPSARRPMGALAAAALLFGAAPARGQTAAPVELDLRAYAERHHDEQIAMLERIVNIQSGTMHAAGVKAVGEVLRRSLDSLGFTTSWMDLPPKLERAGHLYAERKGGRGRRILLIGHLDTVFEGAQRGFQRADTLARGAGVYDMKGGDVVILYALKALASAGVLDGMQVSVLLTGDEEAAGQPMSVSRAALVDAARRSDVTIDFEPDAGSATVAQRGATSWILRVTGRQYHSGAIFTPDAGYGAVLEAARIIDGFRTTMAGEPYLTFNPAVIAGGTHVAFDTMALSATAAGKDNIVPRVLTATGDLRFLYDSQLVHAEARMREIVARHLPGTSATISFADPYPAMAPSPRNDALLATLDSVSRALGYGPVEALDPAKRGAADVAFAAPYTAAINGLGVRGGGAHTPDEWVDLRSLPTATARAAAFLLRLSRAGPATP